MSSLPVLVEWETGVLAGESHGGSSKLIVFDPRGGEVCYRRPWLLFGDGDRLLD